MKRLALLVLLASTGFSQMPPPVRPSLGEIVRLDPQLDQLLDPASKIEVLASGFEWAEGPLWQSDSSLLFSDIPRNSIMRWSETTGVQLFLKPSGFTGNVNYGHEPGSNGLTLDAEGRVVACEHGDRRISRLYPDGGKRTVVDNYQGKRLNSPNDLIFKSNGDLYFTDPPYGLPDNFADKRRELDFCGVYRLSPDGKLTLLTKELSRPNGIAFSPDEKTLYVANSDPDRAIWMKFPVQPDGTLGTGAVLLDVTDAVKKGLLGLPDGMKVDAQGNLFAAGPGGINVITPKGQLLGRIDTHQKTANCAWGGDGTTLYITADSYLCRIHTRTKSAVMPGSR